MTEQGTMPASRIKVEIIHEADGQFTVLQTWPSGRTESISNFLSKVQARNQIADLQRLNHYLNAKHPEQPPVIFDIAPDAFKD